MHVLNILLICVAFFQSSESFGIAQMISNYAKVATNKEKEPDTLRNETDFNSTNANETMEIIPDYDDFDDLEADNSTTRAAPMDATSILKFVNGIVNIMALMSSYNKKPTISKPRGNLASDVNSLQDSYQPMAEERFNPDTASKKFKKQADQISKLIDMKYQPTKGTKSANVIDQQYQPVDTYPPYNPFSGTNAETYGSDGGVKTSYDADMDQYKTGKIQMNYLGQPVSSMMGQPGMAQNVEVQPAYSYEVPYQPSKMKESQMGGDDSYSYQQMDNSNDMKMKQKQKFPVYESWMSHEMDHQKPQPMYGDNDGTNDMDIDDEMGDMDHHPKPKRPIYGPDDGDHSHDHPPKPKRPMYVPDDDDHSHDHPPKPKRPMYISDDDDHSDDHPPKPKRPMYNPDDDDDDDTHPPKRPHDDDDDDDDSDQYQPPKKMKKPHHDDEGRQPWKNQIPDDDFPVYHHEDKKPINYHDFDLEYHHHHDHPPEEEHKHMEEEEDRESKRPYSYYFLGRKLWYVPLIFSVYFIIYIGSLILKSLARHKIQFPEKLWDLHDSVDHHAPADHHRRNRRIDFVTENVVSAIENVKNKYM